MDKSETKTEFSVKKKLCNSYRVFPPKPSEKHYQTVLAEIPFRFGKRRGTNRRKRVVDSQFISVTMATRLCPIGSKVVSKKKIFFSVLIKSFSHLGTGGESGAGRLVRKPFVRCDLLDAGFDLSVGRVHVKMAGGEKCRDYI